MPRSLRLHERGGRNLRLVANEQIGETQRRAGRLRADLQFGRIDEILATGLHAYLTQFLDRVGDLGVGISRDLGRRAAARRAAARQPSRGAMPRLCVARGSVPHECRVPAR